MEAQKLLWIATEPPRPGEEFSLLSITYGIEWLSPEAAFEALPGKDYAAIVLSFPATGWTPCELLEQVQRLAPSVPVLVRDPNASVYDAVRLGRLGVYQLLASGEEAAAQIEQAIEYRRVRSLARMADQVGREQWESLLIGDSREMRRVGHMIRLVGNRRSTVLITGETGTGKELVARSLHLAGARRRAPWVAVNCSALPEHLLEAELFGHVRGAFTGAIQNRIGRFEEAQGGTIFLDEIGDLPLDLQAKLLRVLQERELQRLGSSETIHLDVRVLAATNCDLATRIEQGKFREDLYYRLNVVPIHIPPLRERPEDIAPIATFLVDKTCQSEGVAPKFLSPEAVERLSGYSWPGNVRQLENLIAMAVALSGDRNTLVPADFAIPGPVRSGPAAAHPPFIPLPDQGMDYERTLAQIERSILAQALRKTGGNKKAAASMLCLKRTTLSAKVRSLEPVLGGPCP
jgi:DNA-binding NtrC family response regulator